MIKTIDSHRQAITTKKIAPTHFLPTRIKARCWKGSITVNYDYGLNADDNHFAAARALVEKMGWADKPWAQRWMAGATYDNSGYHFVALTTLEGTETL